ncbi:MarR family transcriptional regulator [Paenibacillus campi]|uniref:MarR family winged helix-turn-helix transcriptional regulator n=1 Tax=Paenibacillus campi TaxID=3106031 RepID=UPI002AFF03C1|nr:MULTISPECIES: MarR family transcriptional regulator [unclassified Paenibacillus]
MQHSALFQQLIPFITSVHQTTTAMTSDIQHDTITPVQYKILEYLAVSPPQTPSSISVCMNMSLPNTSRELRKLSEKGLCAKTSDPSDGRKQMIYLTAAGKQLMDDIFSQIEVRFHERIQHLTAEEVEQVEQALQLLQKQVFF